MDSQISMLLVAIIIGILGGYGAVLSKITLKTTGVSPWMKALENSCHV
jgi:hypothetical protein